METTDHIDSRGRAVAFVMGSATDEPKVASCILALQEAGIPVVSQSMSAHRAAGQVAYFSENLPEITLPESVKALQGNVRFRAACVIAGAGCSAHLAGAVAAKTLTPVIALPIESSAGGTIDSTLSELNMPPGVSNGFAPNNEIAAAMATKLFNLKLPEGYNKVAVSDSSRKFLDLELLGKLGLEIDEESPIVIDVQDIDYSQGSSSISSDKIRIIVPLTSEQLTNDNTGCLNKIAEEGLYMPLQRYGKVNTTNAILFAGQILGSHDATILGKLSQHRRENSKKLIQTNIASLTKDVPRLVAQEKVRQSQLWPDKKTMNTSRGNEELEELGYVRFYTGKNADVYIIPNSGPIQALMVRTDRCSVFDIPLDLQVEGKGAIQNQVALLGGNFAEKHGVRTTTQTLPENIPTSLRDRCQAVELCRPLEVNIESGEKSGVELIFRNYLTGSLKAKCEAGEDPYGVDLPKGLGEMHDLRDASGLALFTPTTKDKNDTPIKSEIVRKQCPEIIESLQKLFKEFTDFCYERGYVIVDTKFEVFINSKGEWALGDEILTPESSRFIKREDFEAGRYISADKQIIRNLGIEFGWKKKWPALLAENPKAKLLTVAHEVTAAHKAQVIAGYQGIYDALKDAA